MLKTDFMIKHMLKRVFVSLTVIAVIFGVVLSTYTVRAIKPLPDDLNALVTATIKPQLLDRNGHPLTVTYQNQWNAHDITPLHRIPNFLQQAFMLAEDKRFNNIAALTGSRA